MPVRYPEALKVENSDGNPSGTRSLPERPKMPWLCTYNVDLEESLVENAVLALAGANQLRITMDGGSLTGRVEGVGNVRYSGDTSSVNVDTDGIVRVRRK